MLIYKPWKPHWTDSIIKLSAQQLSKFCWGKMFPETSKSFSPVKLLWLVAYLSQAWMAPILRLASANSPCSTPACDAPHPVGTCNCEGWSPLTLLLCPGSNCPILKSEILEKKSIKSIFFLETLLLGLIFAVNKYFQNGFSQISAKTPCMFISNKSNWINSHQQDVKRCQNAVTYFTPATRLVCTDNIAFLAMMLISGPWIQKKVNMFLVLISETIALYVLVVKINRVKTLNYTLVNYSNFSSQFHL